MNGDQVGELMFSIPLFPPSMNAIYQVIYSQRRIEMKPEVRLWKSRAKGFIPAWSLEDGEQLEIDMELHGNWIYKNGKPKKIDLQNLCKVPFDAIFEKWGMCDSRVNSWRCRKVQAEQEKIVVVARRVKVA